MSHRKSRVARVIAIAGLALLAGCAAMGSVTQGWYNVNMVNRLAPALQSSVWIHGEKEAPIAAYDGRWTLLVFFDPKAKATDERFLEANDLQERFRSDRVVVFGITEVDEVKTKLYLEDHPVCFSILTDARLDRVTFGIKRLWDPVVYLVDPYERVVARGFEESAGILQEQFGN